MHIQSFSPSKSYYHPGESVELQLEIESEQETTANLLIKIQHLAELPLVLPFPLQLKASLQPVSISWQPPIQKAGYGVLAELFDQNGELTSFTSLSFDVLGNWTDFPRYGFLTDFSATRPDPQTTIAELARFHINGLQFYDWQYRHDQLLAPTRNYIDPLGRAMSLETVSSLVEAAAGQGIAAMPYLAIYGASAAFWRAHPESALYDASGKPIAFGEDFLGIMNPTAGTFWQKHLLDEGDNVLRAIPFAGLHIDQYGEPKQAWDAQGHPVDLPTAFSDFIKAARKNHPDRAILFNAVGNWPVEALAISPLDFMYIEIWPPETHYLDVARIVLNAVQLSGGKPVVIALYLPADQTANVMLANAVIAACGGSRIELGENSRLLTDPYFPKHQPISADLNSELIEYYDFLVQYGEWLQSYDLSQTQRQIWAQAVPQPDYVQIDGQVLSIVRQHSSGITVNLVNFNTLDLNLEWDKAHAAPQLYKNLSIRLQLSWKPKSILWACPGQSLTGPANINFVYRDGEVIFSIPELNLLGVFFIHD